MSASKLEGLPILGAELPMLGRAIRQQAPMTRAAAGAAGVGVRNAAKDIKTGMLPTIDRATADLGAKAIDMGIKIPLDAIFENKYARFTGEALRDIPLSGSKRAANTMAGNKAIMANIGAETPSGKISWQEFSAATEKAGSIIGEISAKYPVTMGQLTPAFAEIVAGLKKKTPTVEKVINGWMDDIGSRVERGAIDGTAMRRLRSELTRDIRAESDGGVRAALSGLDEALLDAIKSNMTAAELPAFNQARYHYSQAMGLEPMIAKLTVRGATDISPAAYAQAITSTANKKKYIAQGKGGDAADVSAVLNRFTKEPQSSGSAERYLAQRVLSHVGSVGMGTAASVAGGVPGAAALYGVANLYNRLGPGLAEAIIRKSKTPDAPIPPRPPVEPQPGLPPSGPLPTIQNPTLMIPGFERTPLNPVQARSQLPMLPDAHPMLSDQYQIQRGSASSGLFGHVDPRRVYPTGQIPSTPLPALENPMGMLSSDLGAVGGGRIVKSGERDTRISSSFMDQLPRVETHDFMLRQEVLQQPAIRQAIEAFSAEANRLQDLIKNSSGFRRNRHIEELNALQARFDAGMEQMGIRTAGDATGASRKLYQGLEGTKLPILKSTSQGMMK